jgi:hypothetical protein
VKSQETADLNTNVSVITLNVKDKIFSLGDQDDLSDPKTINQLPVCVGWGRERTAAVIRLRCSQQRGL